MVQIKIGDFVELYTKEMPKVQGTKNRVWIIKIEEFYERTENRETVLFYFFTLKIHSKEFNSVNLII